MQNGNQHALANEKIEETSQLERAAQILRKEEVVAIPTETVYGLAGNAFSEKAVKSIFEIKGRPSTNPLIVHIGSKNKLKEIATDIPEAAHKLINQFWPGPLTLVLKKQEHISNAITAGKDTVAVRMPDHQLTLDLLQKLDFPLVAPSANKSNHISPTSPAHVKNSLGDKTPFILDGGPCLRGIESTIIGFINGQPEIFRYGAIGKEEIEEVLSTSLNLIHSSQLPLAPGMFKKHYSPKTLLIASTSIIADIIKHSEKKIGVIYFDSNNVIEGNFPFSILSEKGNLTEAAQNLYKSLYELEQRNLDLIIAEMAPSHGVGLSINDRLYRASYKNH